uniref:Uncharacterized protein n=1 Tax=Daucus carota subsp. sativus TaxID=79200 RepID=A0A161XSC5_DAUCS
MTDMSDDCNMKFVKFFVVQAKIETSKNALLADVCVATSAAPTFLPAQYFETKHEDGKTRSFNLIDWGGGVAARNITDDNHTGNTTSVDVATTTSMEALADMGSKLLEKFVGEY